MSISMLIISIFFLGLIFLAAGIIRKNKIMILIASIAVVISIGMLVLVLNALRFM